VIYGGVPGRGLDGERSRGSRQIGEQNRRLARLRLRADGTRIPIWGETAASAGWS
jgi:hypothetical protein